MEGMRWPRETLVRGEGPQTGSKELQHLTKMQSWKYPAAREQSGQRSQGVNQEERCHWDLQERAQCYWEARWEERQKVPNEFNNKEVDVKYKIVCAQGLIS